MKHRQDILELSTTVAPESQVSIDGKLYPLRTRPSTPEALRLRDLGEEAQSLMEKRGEERSAGADDRIVEINDLMTAGCIDAPAAVLAKLPLEERNRLIAYVTAEIKNRRDPISGGSEQPPD